MVIRIVVGIVGMVVVGISGVGCGDPGPGMHGNPGPERVAELENGLRSKPSFEAARAEYAGAMNQMANQIAALVPGMTWQVDENSWRGCGGEYVWTRAVQVFYRILFDRAIPDDVWPKAVQIVKDGAARFGATNVSVFVDQPGSKDLAISNPDGAQFHFGTKVQTVLSATSDCRMRATDTPEAGVAPIVVRRVPVRTTRGDRTSTSQTTGAKEPEPHHAPYRNSLEQTKIRSRRILTILNWILALVTVPGGLVVMAFAFAAAMSTDRCAYEYCPRQGPPSPVFAMLFYGAPFVAVLTCVASFWTARRGWGILIPLAALTFLAIDFVVIYLTFRP